MLVKNPGVSASLREKSKGWCGRVLVASYVLIAIAAVVPYGSKVQSVSVASIGLDKIVHFIGFACMAVFSLGAGRGSSYWKRAFLVAVVLLFGVFIEVVQFYIPYRTFNPVDIAANLFGMLFGILVWYLFLARVLRRRAEKGLPG